VREVKYWYKTYIDYCPVCGKEEVTKERQYTPKPEKEEDRYNFMTSLCYSCEYSMFM
jgi:uncharacterized Zn finger protein (UPF0148 family)